MCVCIHTMTSVQDVQGKSSLLSREDGGEGGGEEGFAHSFTKGGKQWIT